jgi:hypothetical protein
LDVDSHRAKEKLTKHDLISNESEVIYQGLIQWDETNFDIVPSGTGLYLSTLAPASDDIYARILRFR